MLIQIQSEQCHPQLKTHCGLPFLYDRIPNEYQRYFIPLSFPKTHTIIPGSTTNGHLLGTYQLSRTGKQAPPVGHRPSLPENKVSCLSSSFALIFYKHKRYRVLTGHLLLPNKATSSFTGLHSIELLTKGVLWKCHEQCRPLLNSVN